MGGFLLIGLSLTLSMFDAVLFADEVPELKRTIQCPNGANCATFSPNGELLATGSFFGSVATLWDVASGKPAAVLKGHTRNIYNVTFSPDATTIATSGLDRTIRLWGVTDGENKAILRTPYPVHSVRFSPDGKILASASDLNNVEIWSVASREKIATLRGHDDLAVCVIFSPDGKTLATGSHDGVIKFWNVATLRCVATLHGHTEEVHVLRYSPDGKTLASGSLDKTIRLWNVETLTTAAILKGHADQVVCLEYYAGGTRLASADMDDTIKLWGVKDRRVRATFKEKLLTDLAVSADSKLFATVSTSESMKLWELRSP